jgi:hypothetical protein
VGRIGVHAVAEIFEKSFTWFFREQHESDFGIDAHVETTGKDGKPSGKLLALQIKSGSSYFRPHGVDYIYHGELRHLEYWTRHCLPVFIVLHHPETGLTLWQKVEKRLATIKGNRWSMVIPAEQRLEPRYKEHFQAGIAADAEAVRRYRFATDVTLMEEFKDRDVYFRFDVWVNKTLNIRGIDVYFDDYGKREPDRGFDVWAARGDVHDIMRFYFPWLKYEYAEGIEDHSGEIESHVFYVEMNQYAVAYLELERFFADGPVETDDPEPPGDDNGEWWGDYERPNSDADK